MFIRQNFLISPLVRGPKPGFESAKNLTLTICQEPSDMNAGPLEHVYQQYLIQQWSQSFPSPETPTKKTTKQGNPAKRPKLTEQKGLDYPCNLCEYVASKLSNLKRHIATKHEAIRYPCDQCEYTSPSMDLLQRHKDSKHNTNGYTYVYSDSITYPPTPKVPKTPQTLRFPCNQCEYSANTKSNLKSHVETEHEGIRYPCDQCDFAATKKTNLMQHKAGLNKIRFQTLPFIFLMQIVQNQL